MELQIRLISFIFPWNPHIHSQKPQMTDRQWVDLLKVMNGEFLSPMPAGFIIDSPWLPNWYGINIIDYFSSDGLWLKANLKAIEDFPEIWFLPGFWSEY